MWRSLLVLGWTCQLAHPFPMSRPIRSRTIIAKAAAVVEDELVSAISEDGFVSAKAIVTTELMKEVSKNQGTLPLASAALGRALTCCLLLSQGLKGEESFQIKFQGDGPLGGILAIANGKLEAKGYCANPKVTLKPNALGKIDVGGGVGKGNLYVVRTKMLPGEVNPSTYSSITTIRSGEVAEDINYYLSESEQREGALAAGVYVDENSAVEAVGGWTVQLLPGAPDAVAEKVMENLQAMTDSPTEMVRKGLRPTDIINLLLKDQGPKILQSERPAYKCTCSDDRVFRTLALLPVREIIQIMETNEKVEAKCEFCGKLYRLEHDVLKKHIDGRMEEERQKISIKAQSDTSRSGVYGED